jgi:hypothetical protein
MTEPFVSRRCSCGDIHELPAEAREFWGLFFDGLPPRVPVTAPGGTWLVPRIYIAVHGLKADDLPQLAAAHRWERRQ